MRKNLDYMFVGTMVSTGLTSGYDSCVDIEYLFLYHWFKCLNIQTFCCLNIICIENNVCITSIKGEFNMPKTALITGSTSGLGFEFVKLFANDGYHLVLVARSKQKLEDIKNSFHDTEITVICKDLTEPNAAKEVIEEVEKHGLDIDVLVNNAGFGLLGTFDELDIQKQLNMIQLNIKALTELTYYVLPKMKHKNSGKILNVASTAAFQPGPTMAVYFATKAYVLSFSEALVEELSDTQIKVTTLCPGPTKTNFGSTANAEGSKLFNRPMNSETVAKQGYNALMNGKRVVITGKLNKASVLAVRFIPRSTAAKIAKFVTKKK